MRFPQQILPQLVDETAWMTAVESMTSDEMAVEFFGIKSMPASDTPIMRLPSTVRNINAASPDMAMRICDLLTDSTYDWEAQFRKQVNAVVSQLLGVNTQRARLLTKCIRDAEKEAKDYDKHDRQKNGTPEQLASYRLAAEEARSRAETLRMELQRCRLGLEVPTQALVALGESTVAADAAIALLDNLRKQVFSLLDSRKDPANLQYGMLKDDQYLDTLDRLTQSMSRGRWHDEFARSLKMLDTSARSIYDNDFSTKEVSLYPSSATADLTRHMDWCKKECDRYRKRLSEVKNQISGVKGGRKTHYSFQMLCHELTFWSTFLTNFSAVMAGALEPQIAIVNGIVRDGRQ